MLRVVSCRGSEPSAPTEAPGAREASAGEAEAAVGKSDEVSLATPAHRVSREGNGDVRVCITLPEVRDSLPRGLHIKQYIPRNCI